jgi:hypothetical protein
VGGLLSAREKNDNNENNNISNIIEEENSTKIVAQEVSSTKYPFSKCLSATSQQ